MTIPPQPRLGPLPAGVLVFLTAGAVLVLEILSLRLIAPYVGLTLETSTAVIGTALAAIAAGAWVGGWAADTVDARRLIGPVLLGAGVLVLMVLPAVRWAGELHSGPPSIASLMIPALAIFLPAALLSMVSPMVVKVRLASLEETGSVVGQLSGIGTLGALVATFATGFVLVATIPASTTLMVLGWAVLALGTAATLGLGRGRETVAAVGLAGVGALAGVAALGSAPQPCDVETAYHCVSVAQDPARPSGRVLRLDLSRHSYVDLADPTHLEFRYVRAMADAVDAQWPSGRALNALHVGGGGVTLPRWLAATRPGSTNEVLEIDPGVVDVATEELGLRAGGDLAVRVVDGRAGLGASPDASIDLVVGDAFSGPSVPWHLTTREMVQEVRRVLGDGGLYLINVIDYPPLDFARAEVVTLASAFEHVAIATYPGVFSGKDGGNILILASDSPLPNGRFSELLAASVSDWTTTADPQAVARLAGDAKVLTDDFAPVDQLLTVYPSG